MNKYGSLLLCLTITLLGVGLSTASAQGLQITSHQNGAPAFYGAHIVLQCSGGVPPYAWSGQGSFSPATGTPVTWTAPTSGSTATVTVTDSCGNHASVTFNLRNIIFVDKDRPGVDGTTWEKAFKHVQDALAVAISGTEIWVAEATYYPDEDKTHPNGGGSGVTFTLVPGTGLYGGFIGSEATRNNARDRRAHETILSGDVHRSDPPSLDAGNCDHVVSCTSGTNTTVLDGFTITMGYSDYYQCDGAGIDLHDCSPTIAYCQIKQNQAWENDGDGGGMHCFHASPTVLNCIFLENIADDDGGALCNKNGSNGTFTNCVFYANHTGGREASSHGGAIFNTRGEPWYYVGCTPTFTNCLIANNYTSAEGDGGGAADNGADVSVTWVNCTFYANRSADDGGGLATRDGAASTVQNCIFWANTAGGHGSQVWQGGTPDGTATFAYCDILGGFGGTSIINSDPQFLTPTDPDGTDNRFLTSDDGLQISQWSPCFNAASASYAPATDILGSSRGSQPDIGAYECDMADADGDGMPNWFDNGYSLNSVDDDPDGDGWRNCTEYLLRTNPRDGTIDGMTRMPNLSGPLEIEAKWMSNQSLNNTIYAAFPQGGSYTVGSNTYTADLNWSGGERVYADDYFDDTATSSFHNGLQGLRHRQRRRLSGTVDWDRVEYKSTPTRYGAGWFREEYGSDQNLNATQVAEIFDLDADPWTPASWSQAVQGVFTDYGTYNHYDTLAVYSQVSDNRRKTDLWRASAIQFNLSFDHVTLPAEEYHLEIEVIAGIGTEVQVEEFFRLIFDFQHRYPALTPCTTSNGGIYAPDYFE